MKRAIVTLTSAGAELGSRLHAGIPGSVLYTMPGRGAESSIEITGTLKEFTGSIFNSYNVIIFIMAAGIVVRTIADFIKDKTSDPGILVMDEKGKFVISLLSGHMGGANREAEFIASVIGATPVITTASDLNGMLSPDMLAMKYGCVISDMKICKDITAVMLNSGKIAFSNDCGIELYYPYVSNDFDFQGIIYLTNKVLEYEKNEEVIDGMNGEKTKGVKTPSLHLIPKNIVIGTGCRKGNDPEELVTFITDELNLLGIDHRAVCSVSSIDIKSDEPAIKRAAEFFNAELMFYSPERIVEVEHMFQCSEFVREKTGAGGVAEPCAYLASDCQGEMLLQKKKRNGMTMAVMQKPVKEIF